MPLEAKALNVKFVTRLYCAGQVLFGLLLWLPVFYEYQKRIGLSDAQIFSIQTIYYVAFMLLDLPTGFFADRFGFRFSMVLGAAFLAASNILAIFSQNYGGFLAHFLLIAVARSLMSGAGSAYLYEYLEQKGETQLYRAIEGKARAYGLTTKVLGWSVIGWLMNYHLTLPYWLTFACNGAAIAILLWLPEVRVAGREQKRVGLWQAVSSDLSGVVKSLWGAPVLLLLMLQGTGFFVMERIVQVNLYQPILGSKSFNVGAYGWIMSLTTLCEAAASWLPQKVWRHVPRISDLSWIFIFTLVEAGALAAMTFSNQLGTLVLMCLFALATGAAYPMQRQLINDAITEPRYRASLLSIESIVGRVACAIFASVAGAFVASGRMHSFMHLAALLIVLLVGCAAFSLRLVLRKNGRAALLTAP